VLIDEATGQKLEQKTDATGRFTLSGVPAGEYRLKVQQLGFVSDQGKVKLVPGRRVERPLTLQFGTISETVKVSMVPKTPGGANAPSSPNRPKRFDQCGQAAPVGCIAEPEKLADAVPEYPPQPLKNGVSGQVTVVGRVGTDGRLEALEPEPNSDPVFTKATLDALRLWKYSPALVSGKPVTCRIVVTVIYGR